MYSPVNGAGTVTFEPLYHGRITHAQGTDQDATCSLTKEPVGNSVLAAGAYNGFAVGYFGW